MKLKNEIKYALSGAAAGLANGFFGAGGGMFLVPLFCRWIKLCERKAFATSLAVIMPISVVSGIIYLMRQDFDIMGALPFFVGGLIGGIIGGAILKKMPVEVLRRALALFIIYGGIRAIFKL